MKNWPEAKKKQKKTAITTTLTIPYSTWIAVRDDSFVAFVSRIYLRVCFLNKTTTPVPHTTTRRTVVDVRLYSIAVSLTVSQQQPSKKESGGSPPPSSQEREREREELILVTETRETKSFSDSHRSASSSSSSGGDRRSAEYQLETDWCWAKTSS